MNQVVVFECPDCETRIPLDVTLGEPVPIGDGTVEVPGRGNITDVWAHSLTCPNPEENR